MASIVRIERVCDWLPNESDARRSSRCELINTACKGLDAIRVVYTQGERHNRLYCHIGNVPKSLFQGIRRCVSRRMLPKLCSVALEEESMLHEIGSDHLDSVEHFKLFHFHHQMIHLIQIGAFMDVPLCSVEFMGCCSKHVCLRREFIFLNVQRRSPLSLRRSRSRKMS